MDKDEYAKSLLPPGGRLPPAVVVDLPVEIAKMPEITDGEVQQIMEECGLVSTSFNGAALKSLKKLGIHTDKIGFMDTQKGSTIAGQAQLRAVLAILTYRIQTDGIVLPPEELAALSKSAGYLAKILTETHKVAVDHFGSKVNGGGNSGPAARVPSLPPGAPLQIAIHNAPGASIEISGKAIDSRKPS